MSSVHVLEKVIDSKDFTVGGGSAAALAGAMAAGMVAMVARLSTKKDYGLSAEKYMEIAEEGDHLAKDLLLGAEKDTQAFCMIKDAYALPKATDEEKKQRSQAIQNGAIQAATVPMQNGQMCKRVQELSLLLDGQSNPNAGSDLAEAILLAGAGVKGCVLNIEANLPLIKNEKVKADFQKQIEILSK
ncbi:cyclodeaminase/cyclohydrolase family protein [Clostridiaceae bacterium 35-E11]